MLVTDLDDTLYKEIDYVRSGIRAIAELLGHESIMDAEYAYSVIANAPATAIGFDRLAAIIQMVNPQSPYNTDWMVDVYRNHIPTLQLEEDVRSTFTQIINLGHKIGIITDGRSKSQRAKINTLGINEFISPENIIISSEIGGDKTTSIPFETIATRNPEERHFIYLGDNPAKDFYWPNQLGWTTIQLQDINNINIHSQSIDVPKDYKARFQIDTIHEIVGFMNYM